MDFEIISEIVQVETFARGVGVRIRQFLNAKYAGGRKVYWRHCKGFAEVEYVNGEIWFAEVHWFEAHGIGRVMPTDKRRIRRIA